jgi:hypothetical protein
MLSDCAARLAKLQAVSAGSFDAQLDDACGQPIVYPLSAKCITLMGSAGPMLQHRSELVMRIWRSCPEENPCNSVTRTDPACSGQALTPVADIGATGNNACQKAQDSNYSCAALRKDPVYLERLREPSALQAADDDCAANKNRLAQYDKHIEEMSVRIQWYRVFADKGL